MFAAPTSYCVTPGGRPSLPGRASSLLRDVKRRSLRSYRAATGRADRRLSGTFLQLGEAPRPTGRAGQVPAAAPTTTPRCSAPRPPSAPTTREDKENLMPEAPCRGPVTPTPPGPKVLSDRPPLSPADTPVISRTQSLRRRCSNYFTPKSKRPGPRERTPTMRLPSGRRPTPLGRPLPGPGPGEGQAGESPRAGAVSGEGRLIPVKQGYMYKRSGGSRLYRRKYVTLCGDSVLTYWPSFQAYRDNVEGKEIELGHVTVKVPGRPPTGVRTAEEEEELARDLSLEELEEERQDGLELVLVSLDSSIWHFQVCAPREVREWEEAIQAEILASLTRREARPDLGRVRGLPGNQACADCGARDPDWASLNLGILVCIECSGIHRNLGSHVSKVRSLSLDTWTPAGLACLERPGGNRAANAVWEARARPRPAPGASRGEKEQFIRAKYVLRAFCCPTSVSSHGVLI